MAPPLLAASITPLRDGGAPPDEAAIAPLLRHPRDGGADGIFFCGTPRGGGMLTRDERQRGVPPGRGLGRRVYVGKEPLIPEALAAGAHGSVSGLANAFPGDVARLLREPTAENTERVRSLRDALGGATFVAAVKWVLK